jgi:hypothetical protein
MFHRDGQAAGYSLDRAPVASPAQR